MLLFAEERTGTGENTSDLRRSLCKGVTHHPLGKFVQLQRLCVQLEIMLWKRWKGGKTNQVEGIEQNIRQTKWWPLTVIISFSHKLRYIPIKGPCYPHLYPSPGSTPPLDNLALAVGVFSNVTPGQQCIYIPVRLRTTQQAQVTAEENM